MRVAWGRPLVDLVTSPQGKVKIITVENLRSMDSVRRGRLRMEA